MLTVWKHFVTSLSIIVGGNIEILWLVVETFGIGGLPGTHLKSSSLTTEVPWPSSG